VSLYAALKNRLFSKSSIGFLTSWTILVLPLLSSMTVFANHPLYLDGVLLLANLLVIQLPRKASGIPLPSNSSTRPATPPKRLPPLPALTTYRAHMMLMTVLAILAVDFPVFPRSLVKCETFGASMVCFLIFPV
jgi:phosphatidylinositol glycan class W